MPTIRDALDLLDEIAPPQYAFSFDKVGLQVGDPSVELSRGVVTLDRSIGAVEYARGSGAQLVVAHHPLIFEPLQSVTSSTHVGRTLLALARAGIAFSAVHTNWDAAEGGINDALASLFGLENVRRFGSAAAIKQLKLVFFAPAENVDDIVDAVSEAGAGVIGLYRRCAFFSQGMGTFLADERANPQVGQVGQVETVEEVRVEMVLPESKARAVADALRQAHPYEEPAFDFLAASPVSEQPAGRIGTLAGAMTLEAFAMKVDSKLHTRCWTWGARDRKIEKVAVVGGAAAGEWRAAAAVGADVLLTGEVKQHEALEAAESGCALIAAGHYATEQPGMEVLRQLLTQRMPSVEWLLFEPAKGSAGRPL
jgi:dinuclear metal center YbgI/SA1388 family protein